MEAIEAYQTDSNDSSDEQSGVASNGIRIVEGSSKSLKPSDFFGLESSEESEEPPSKKIKTEDEEKKPVVMVQGSAVEVPNSDFWKDVTHKQIVFINNSLGSNQLLMKSGQIYLSGNGSDGLFNSASVNSNDATKIVQFVQTSSAQEGPVSSTVAKPEKTLQKETANTSGPPKTTYTIPLAKPMKFVSFKQPCSLNALGIPSTQTIQSVPATLKSAAISSTCNSQTVVNVTPSTQSVHSFVLDKNKIPSSNISPSVLNVTMSAQAVQNLAVNAIKIQPFKYSQTSPQEMQNAAVNAIKIQPSNNCQTSPLTVQNCAANSVKLQPLNDSQTVLGFTPFTQTEQINTSNTSLTTTTLRAMLNSQPLSKPESSSIKSQTCTIIPTQVMSSSISSSLSSSSSSSSLLDSSVKTAILRQLSPQTYLLPAMGDQPAKLIQLFPANSIVGKNLAAGLPTSVGKNLAAGLPTSVGKNLAAALPTSVAQTSVIPTVQNTFVSEKLDEHSLLKSRSSLVPVIKLVSVSEKTSQSVGESEANTVKSPSQLLASQQLHDLATHISDKNKSEHVQKNKQNKSELLRLLQSPLVTSPVSLHTSTLTPKYTEAEMTNKIHSTVIPHPNNSGIEASQASDNSLKTPKPLGTENNIPLSVSLNNSLSETVSRKELLKVNDKVSCLLNKTFIKKKPPTRLDRSFFAHGVSVNRIKWCCHKYSHLLLSASMDGTVKVFNGLSSGDAKMVLQVYAQHMMAVKDAEWSGDGKSILSCSYDKTALVTDVETGKNVSRLCHNSYVSCGKFHPILGKNVITGSKNIIEAWDIRTPEKPVRVFKYKDKMGQIQDVLFDKDGQQVFSTSGVVSRDSADRSIMAWDYSTGAVLSNQIFQERYSCTRLKLHPTQNLFLCQTQGGYISIFSTKRPYEMVWSKRYEGHKMEGYDIGFDISADGSVVVSGSADGILHCYSNFTGKLWRTMKTGFDVCLDAAFHPVLPSTVACCSSKGQIKIFH